MDDRAFIAAAVDFSDAGPSQFHPGFEQYRDLALVAQRIATPSAPRPDAGEVERLHLWLARINCGVCCEFPGENSDCIIHAPLSEEWEERSNPMPFGPLTLPAVLRTPAAGVEGDWLSGVLARNQEHLAEIPLSIRETQFSVPTLAHPAPGNRPASEAEPSQRPPANRNAVEEVERLEDLMQWFGTKHNLELHHYSPVRADEDDDAVEWRVTKVSGPINDREWDTVGRGETPVAAILSARAALSPESRS